jgi:Protein of unknown function (DUF1161)
MKSVSWCVGGVLLLLSATPVLAKTCDELKAEIDARIRSNGVTVFELQVVEADAAEGLKVVGTCGAGKKKIVYLRP